MSIPVILELYLKLVCLYQCLHFFQSPHLSAYIDTVLPTALIILDDHVFHNRITGMQCIEHIVNNVVSQDIVSIFLTTVYNH